MFLKVSNAYWKNREAWTLSDWKSYQIAKQGNSVGILSTYLVKFDDICEDSCVWNICEEALIFVMSLFQWTLEWSINKLLTYPCQGRKWGGGKGGLHLMDVLISCTTKSKSLYFFFSSYIIFLFSFLAFRFLVQNKIGLWRSVFLNNY